MEHAAIQILLLLLVGCLVALVARRFRVPYTLALVVAGVLLGFVHVEELEVFHLSSDVLFTFLLPALLFEAAFHLDLEDFRRNAVVILTLALGGVVLLVLAIAQNNSKRSHTTTATTTHAESNASAGKISTQ